MRDPRYKRAFDAYIAWQDYLDSINHRTSQTEEEKVITKYFIDAINLWRPSN